MNAPRCATPGSPTCVIPGDARGTHRCPHCDRVWVGRDDGHGPYWHHNAKAAKR